MQDGWSQTILNLISDLHKMADERDGSSSLGTDGSPVAKKSQTSCRRTAMTVETLSAAMSCLVDDTRKRFESEENLEEFISNDLGKLGKAIGLYCSALRELSVTTFADFEACVKDDYRHSIVSDSYEELLLAEDKWAELLREIESKKTKAENVSASANCEEGASVPMDMTFIRVSDNKTVSLGDLCAGSKRLLLIILRHLA